MDIGVSLLQGLSLYGLSNQLTRTMKVIYIIWQTRKQFSTSARESEKSIISNPHFPPPHTHTHTHTHTCLNIPEGGGQSECWVGTIAYT